MNVAAAPAAPRPETQASSAWADAVAAATLMAIDPVGLGGVNLRALASFAAVIAGRLNGTP